MLVLFNKPFRVMSQFRPVAGKATLADYLSIPGIHPAGRLDYDSEGLLLLTDDGRLQQRLSDPRFGKVKVYWAQVEGQPTAQALRALAQGVVLKDGMTRPAGVRLIDVPAVWERVPPIRERREIPTSWLELRLSEGRNRQVRRMTAHVGHPTLRLLRVAVGPWQLGDLAPGAYHVVEAGAQGLPVRASRQPRPRPRPRRGR